MDTCLTNFHRLTFRSRLHNFWHRFVLYVTGVRYTFKLLRFTHRNVLVLRHFQRCREVEAAVTQSKKTRFPYLPFYKHTWQQSRKLFTPVRTSTMREPQPGPVNQHQSQPVWDITDIEKELPALSWSSDHLFDRTDSRLRTIFFASPQRRPQGSDSSSNGILEDEGDIATETVSKPGVGRDKIHQHNPTLLQLDNRPLRSTSHSCNHHSHITTPTKRKPHRIRIALQKGFLALWHTPRFLLWKLGTFFRTRIFKVKLRSLYQRQQIELLRERQRIVTSTQTALFLSFANTIDLYTTRELATLCQHVSRARRKRKMTEEDFTCFDQSVTDLDKNHETLRQAA